MKSYTLLLVVGLLSLTSAAQIPVGIFENHDDIGQVLNAQTAREQTPSSRFWDIA